MNIRPFFARFGVALTLAAAACPCRAGDAAAGRYPLSDQARAGMLAARDRVFPSLIFIKVVQQTHERGEKSARETAGSGVLISADGEFLTNWHVVDKAAGLRCLLTDGRTFAAELIGSDKDTDLALGRLTLPPGTTVPFAPLGDSAALTEGDPVFVMGAPWGLSRSISAGIISCTRRYLAGASEYTLWLQTDASVNPGNSGGPVVSGAGEVIGITARGMFFGGDLAFAIPANEATVIVGQLRSFGRMNWSWTGLQLQPIRDFDRNVYFDFDSGVIVSATDPASPARAAGILPKDRITAVNGLPVTACTQEDIPRVNRILGLLPKETPAAITVLRGDETVILTVTPRAKGRVEGDEMDFPRWDFTAKAVNQFDTPDLFFYREKGVFVYGTKHPGNAANAGLNAQDIIVSVGARDIETLSDLASAHNEALEALTSNHRAIFTVLRNGLHRQIVLDFSRDFNRR
jgi:serine protease Do